MDKPIDHARLFCNHYFSHPLWSANNSPDREMIKWMRFSLLPSDWLRDKVAAQSVSVLGDLGPQELVFGEDNFKNNLREIFKVNWQGFNLYYFCNMVDPNLGPAGSGRGRSEFCTNHHVHQRLFIPLDYDFPIGVEVGELEDELGLRFSAVVESSPGRLQCLVPVQFQQKEGEFFSISLWEIDQEDAVKYFQQVCAADVMPDAKRLLRLPGTRNWKYAEVVPGESGRGKKLVVPTARLVRWEEEYEVYGLDEVRQAALRAEGSALFRELGEVRAMRVVRSTGRPVGASDGLDKGRSGAAGVPEDLVGWELALETIERGGRLYGDDCGFRHNALRTWAAQMCYAGLDWSQGKENLDRLASGGFDSDYRVTRDYGALVGTSERFWRRVEDERARENRWLEEDGGGDEEDRDEDTGGSDENTGTGDSIDTTGSGDSDCPTVGQSAKSDKSKLTTNKNTRKISVAFEGKQGWESLAFIKETAKRLPTESEDEYFQFLARIVVCASRSRAKESGTFGPLSDELFKRLKDVGVVRDRRLTLPMFREVDGLRLAPNVVTEEEARAFLQWYVIEIASAVNKNTRRLREVAEIAAKGPKFICKMPARGESLSSVVSLLLGQIVLTRGAMEQRPGELILQNGRFALEDSRDGKETAGDFFDDSSEVWYRQARWRYPNPVSVFYRPDRLLNGHAVDDKLSLMPRFKEFLEDAFAGEGNRATREDLVFRIIGYCLIRGNPFQKFFGFIGATGAGKGVMCELLENLVGNYGSCRISYNSLSEPWGFGPLEGKTLCIADEAESANKGMHEDCMSGIKRYTGSSRFSLRGMRENERVVDATAKILITCNKDLSVSDSHSALTRRLVCLWFANTKPSGGQVSGLGELIAREEGDLIASWAAIRLAQVWPLGADIFEVGDSLALRQGKEEVGAMINPVQVALRSLVRRVLDMDCPSYVLSEIINILIKSEKIPKPTGQIEKVIKQVMTTMGFDYSRTKQQKIYRDCIISAEGVRQLFDEPDSSIILRFSGAVQEDMRSMLNASPIE